MSERHKHADVIHAWAEGAELEVKQYFANGHEGPWEPFKGEDAPFFNSWRYEYRIKPKIVKREGWIARLSSDNAQGDFPRTTTSGIYNSLDSLRLRHPEAKSYHPITWEEEA